MAYTSNYNSYQDLNAIGFGGGAWTGGVSASGAVTQSYAYSTESVYTPPSGSVAGGWSTTGSMTSSGSGSTSEAFSAQGDDVTVELPTDVHASGSGQLSESAFDSYSATEQSYLEGGAWQASGGSGSITSSGDALWAYGASGAYSSSAYDVPTSGSGGAQGGGDSSYSYTEDFVATPQGDDTFQWNQPDGTDGSGSASGDAWSEASYSGSGSTSADYGVYGSSSMNVTAEGDQSSEVGYGVSAQFVVNGGNGNWQFNGGGSATGSGSYDWTYTGNSNYSAYTGSPDEVKDTTTTIYVGGNHGSASYDDQFTIAPGDSDWNSDVTAHAVNEIDNYYNSSESQEDVASGDVVSTPMTDVSNATTVTTQDYDSAVSSQPTSVTTFSGSGAATILKWNEYTNSNFTEQENWQPVSADDGPATQIEQWGTGGTPYDQTFTPTQPSFADEYYNFVSSAVSANSGPVALQVNEGPITPSLASAPEDVAISIGPFFMTAAFTAPYVLTSISSTLPATAHLVLPTSSLFNIPNPPAQVSAVWGMNFLPETAPRTALAQSSASLTIVSTPAVDKVFGSDLGVEVMPMDVASRAMLEALAGVKAAPNAPAQDAEDTPPDSAVQGEWGTEDGALDPEAAPTSSGGSDAASSAAPVKSEPVLNGHKLFIANVKKFISHATTAWSPAQQLGYVQGVGSGFLAGLQGTFELLKSVPAAVLNAERYALENPISTLTTLLDPPGAALSAGHSFLTWVLGVDPAQDPAGAAQAAQKKAQQIAAALQAAGHIAGEVAVVGGEFKDNFVSQLVQGTSVSLESTFDSSLDQALDAASPLTLSVLNLAAAAGTKLSPENQGYVVGFVAEQILEAVALELATEGTATGLKMAQVSERLAKGLEAVKGVSPELAKVIESIGAKMKGLTTTGLDAAGIAKEVDGVTEVVVEAELAEAGLLRTAIQDHCFAAGTPILTPTGEKFIEEFKVGDEILSRPEDSPDAPVRASTVEKVFRLSGPTLELCIGGQVIVTTEKHPFFVIGKGWTWAGQLQSDDLILGHCGRTTPVESIALTGRYESLYNLRVAFDRTYFVGSRTWGFSLWVHNIYKPVEIDGVWKVGSYDKEGNLVKVLESDGGKVLTQEQASEAAMAENFRASFDAKQAAAAPRTNPLAARAADLGYTQRIPPQKLPFNSHGQPAFFNGKRYITPDVDSHRGGVWKMFDLKGRRLGTYDAALNRIGD